MTLLTGPSQEICLQGLFSAFNCIITSLAVHDSDTSFSRATADGVAELCIPSCLISDSGIYQCYFENKLGTAETAAYIGIEGM